MENPNPTPQGGQAPEAGQPNAFDELRTKKGFKDNDSFAKSYTEVEQSYGRTQNALNTAKQNLETQSQGMYTLDDKGGMVLTEKGQQYQQQQQYQPQQPNYQQPAQEEIYDPYSGKPITDPATRQFLMQYGPGQREAVLFNAMAEQREVQQRSAFQHETEVLSTEAAKGFEQDVKKVIMQLPLAQRADKKSWENALLQVKGARYDQDKQNWGQQANTDLLNKMGNQGLPQGGGQKGSSGVQLPSDLEQQYQWYERNRPGFFKSKEEFMQYTSPSGGK